MFDPLVTLAGALVGFVVGLTGMGGGALMTPVLVLLFGIQPLAAVSSDIVASMVMKPIGGGVHLRHGTVNRSLVKWLVVGSVPSAFLGVVLLKYLGVGPELQGRVKIALGVALLVVSIGLIVRPLLVKRKRPGESLLPVIAKPVPTMLIGVIGGLVVGLTSVGSGSLIIIMLLMLYPSLKLSELVGTDLVQAVPLVTSAALGHLLYGDFQLGLTGAILLGSIPGVFIGARFSSRAPDYVIRPSLIVVLTISALKLLGVSNGTMIFIIPVAVGAGVFYAVRASRKAREVQSHRPAELERTPASEGYRFNAAGPR
jgi:uncharacterized membrane protein YfcA